MRERQWGSSNKRSEISTKNLMEFATWKSFFFSICHEVPSKFHENLTIGSELVRGHAHTYQMMCSLWKWFMPRVGNLRLPGPPFPKSEFLNFFFFLQTRDGSVSSTLIFLFKSSFFLAIYSLNIILWLTNCVTVVTIQPKSSIKIKLECHSFNSLQCGLFSVSKRVSRLYLMFSQWHIKNLTYL